MKNPLNILMVCNRKDLVFNMQEELKKIHLLTSVIECYHPDRMNQILENNQIDIVAIDMALTEVNHLEVLKQLKYEHPHLVRLLIAEEWNKELVVLTNDLVHLILEKKNLSNMMVDTIIRAEQMRNILKNDSLRKIIHSFDELPIMQSYYIELLHLLQTPDISLKKVGDLIATDISLSAKVLQVSNMSIFAHIGRINTPQQAVVFLGMNVIRAIVLYLQVFNFDVASASRYRTIKQLESHCLKVAETARNCSKFFNMNQESHDDSFTAGLLHDIGKLILLTKTDYWDDLIKFSHEKQCTLWLAEEELLGTTHAEIGAYLLNLWGFPTKVVDAVLYHHYPHRMKKNELSAVTFTHLAETFISSDNTETVEDYIQHVDQEYLNEMNIQSQTEAFIESYFRSNLES